MFVNDLFKLIENSNEEYYAVSDQRGKPMIMRKPVGKTAQEYAKEKNYHIKGGPFDSYEQTQSFWIRSVLPAKKEQEVAEGISVVDQDYDLDQIVLTMDIEGKRVSFTYTDYEEDFENAERRDVFDQLQQKSWYAGLDHPTKMEILDAAYRAIRGLEPQEYRPTVGDEPLDEQGVVEGLGKNTNDSFIQKLSARLQQLGYTITQEGNVYRWIGSNGTFVEVEPNTEDPGWYGWAEGQLTRSGKLNYGSSGNDSAKDIVSIFKSGGVFRKQGLAEGFDDLDRYMKDKYSPKPSGGSGIKRGTYGQPGRARGRKKGELSGAFHQGGGSDIPHNVGFARSDSERSAGRRMPRFSDDYDSIKRSEVDEGSVQDRLYKRHQELRKKRGAPDPEYYRELKATFDLPDEERFAKAAELKKKYKIKESTITNEDRDRYLEEMQRAGYEIVTEAATLCPECGGAAYADRILAEKQDACYHKVKSRYKVWPSAYASGALVRCRKKGAANWGNKSKK